MSRATERLAQAAPSGADVKWKAPGRANLIGEHTDYNDGFVLPVALDMATYVVGVRRAGNLRLRSLDQAGEVVVDLATGKGPAAGWGRYVAAVVSSMLDAEVELAGLDGVIASDVPIESGLSSSAALEIAVASAITVAPLDPVSKALICQRAENVYVGVQTGIMDQLTSAAGRQGHALLIDCRSNDIEAVAVPEGVSIVVVDSGVGRDLDSSAYNERRKQCEEAARALGVASLRDTDLERLEAARDSLQDEVFRRARHVVTENARVLETARALRASELGALGGLFEQSYRSFADDFEASTPEIETLVGVASETEGVIAARLTGGGWGGCTVNLVEAARAAAAAGEIVERYEAATARSARSWVSAPSDGAKPI